MPRLGVAVISAGPSRHSTWPARDREYALVIAVNRACLDFEADFFAVADTPMIDALREAGKEPRLGWVTHRSAPILQRPRTMFREPYRMIYPGTWNKPDGKWSFPCALEAATYLAGPNLRIDVYGYDHSIDREHTAARWAREQVWIDANWTERMRRILPPPSAG